MRVTGKLTGTARDINIVADLFAEIERFDRRVDSVLVNPADFDGFCRNCSEASHGAKYNGYVWGAKLVASDDVDQGEIALFSE